MPSLKSAGRHEQILERLARRKRLSFAELERAVKASPATLRRDLAELERRGRLLRVHGGVVQPEAILAEVPHADREHTAEEEKELLARKAAADLRTERRLFLDAGTTCLAFARHIIARPELTIYTHSVSILALAPQARARLIGLGGECRPVSMALVGPLTLDWINRLRFDACYLSASGLHPEDGAFTTETYEYEVKAAALRRSKRRILLSDASKLQAVATVNYAAWDAWTDWYCDRPVRLPSTLRAKPVIH